MKKLNAEQTEARDARRARFKELCKRVAALTKQERASLSNRMFVVNTDGHAFSPTNQMLIALQCENPPTICAGFRAWLKAGRVVKKGEHGISIWVPTAKKQEAENTETTDQKELYFIGGTVFDITQTVPLEEEQRATSAPLLPESTPQNIALLAA